MCFLLPWLFSLGFTLLFGSMLVKTWRIHLIFSKKTFEVFKISNRKVMFVLGIILLVDVTLLAVWTGISKTRLQENIIDEYRISENYNSCYSAKGGTIMIWIIVASKILQIIYGGYLALRVRTIPMKQYDESKIIAFCIYNVGLVAIIVSILQATNPTGRYVIFGINSFLVILSTGVAINSMMITKVKSIHMLFSSSTKSSNASSISLPSISSIQSTVIVDEKESLLEENKKLKRKNKRLIARVKELEDQMKNQS